MGAVKVIDKGWNRIKKELKDMDGAFTAVGFPGDVSESQKAVGETGSFTMASLAAVHEYGRRDDSIPSRPFMRQTFQKNLKRIEKLQAKLKDKVIQNKLSIKKALGQLGEWYVGQTKKEITKGDFEQLSEQTILKKGSSKPLVDEGIMRNSITHREHGV